MKVLWVMSLFTVFVFSLIVILDFIMFKSLNIGSIIKNEMSLFEIMEPAEYFIIMMIVFQFVLKAIVGYVKKKKENHSPQNEPK